MTDVRSTLTAAARERRRVLFRPNPGNAGDSLIDMGFYCVADQIGLEVDEVIEPHFDYGSVTADDLFVVAGGGGISSHWPFGAQAIDRAVSLPCPAIFLPQSLQDADELLRRLRPQDILFVRDRYSLAYAESLALDCTLHLDHDLALSADVSTFRTAELLRLPQGPAAAQRAAGIAYHLTRSRVRRHLDAWRTDSEATGAHSGPWRNDIALLTGFGTADRRINTYSAGWLTTILGAYGSVATDRLHVCVAAALMGTPVEVHANNYHKIKGVYEYSIVDHPTLSRLVTFVDGSSERTPR